MNSFVRCLVMLTYTLVIYGVSHGNVRGYWWSSDKTTEHFITKEFCEKRSVEINDEIKRKHDIPCNYYGGTWHKHLGAMCFPTKDLDL